MLPKMPGYTLKQTTAAGFAVARVGFNENECYNAGFTVLYPLLSVQKDGRPAVTEPVPVP